MRSATWARLLKNSETVWLTPLEAALFVDCAPANLARFTLRTKRERSGSRVHVFYDAAQLAEGFSVQNARSKLALLEASPYQLGRELAASEHPAMMRFISACIKLRTSERNIY